MVAIASTLTPQAGSSTAGLLRDGVAGISAGLQKADRAAGEIVSAGVKQSLGDRANDFSSTPDFSSTTPTDTITEAAVDLLEAEIQVKASAAVVRTADELIGTVIDTLA